MKTTCCRQKNKSCSLSHSGSVVSANCYHTKAPTGGWGRSVSNCQVLRPDCTILPLDVDALSGTFQKTLSLPSSWYEWAHWTLKLDLCWSPPLAIHKHSVHEYLLMALSITKRPRFVYVAEVHFHRNTWVACVRLQRQTPLCYPKSRGQRHTDLVSLELFQAGICLFFPLWKGYFCHCVYLIAALSDSENSEHIERKRQVERWH